MSIANRGQLRKRSTGLSLNFESGCARSADRAALEVQIGAVMGTVHPTPECNPKPLKCHGANRGVTRFAAIKLCLVIFVCPATFLQGVERPFMEGLTNELGACPSNVDPPLSAACLQYGSDAGIALQLRRVCPPIALRAEGSYQPRDQGVSGAGKGVEQVEIRVFLC